MSDAKPRTYRFAPIDRTGLLLGLSGTQCLLLGLGVFAAGALLQAGAPLAVTLVPLATAAAGAFARVAGVPAYEVLPVLTRRAAARLVGADRWRASLPHIAAGHRDSRDHEPVLPPFLAGLELIDLGPAPWGQGVPVGAVHDVGARMLAASIPVRGSGFSLLERDDQVRALDGWGDVLAGFCRERTAIAQIRVTEFAAPSGLGESHRRERRPEAASAAEAYADLVEAAGPAAVGHDVLLTISVDERRLRRAGRSAPALETASVVLLEELRLATVRLEAAGLHVGHPLTRAETARVLRTRLDPIEESPVAAPTSLAEATGAARHWAPLAADDAWRHVAVDGSVHRSFWIEDWPRLEVGPAWLEQLVLHAGGVRTVGLIAEPVAPSRSQRRIDRDATRLAADEEQRSRSGFRIGANHRRAQAAVLEREAELVSGFAELEFVGFVTVVASDTEALDRCSADYEQVAAQVGLRLRALHGRHDLGLLCTLPLSRGLARQGFTA